MDRQIERIFNDDIREKKSAMPRHYSRKTRPAEGENGEIERIRIDRFMTKTEFANLSPDLQKEWLGYIAMHFSVGYKEIAAEWGCTTAQVSNIANASPARTARKARTPAQSRDQIVMWREFCDGRKITDEAVARLGQSRQIDKCIEELSELTKAIFKERYAPFDDGVLDNVREETADVQIMLMQIERIFGKKEIAEWRRKKLKRLDDRLGEMRNEKD